MDLINDILYLRIDKEKMDRFNFKLLVFYMFLWMLPSFMTELFKTYSPESAFYTIYAIFFIPLLYNVIYNIKNKYYKNKIDIIIFGIYMIFALISIFMSFNPYYAFFGSSGRKDGFLSLLFYFLLYLNARNIKNEEDGNKLLNIFFIHGMISTVFAFLESYLPCFMLTSKAYTHMGYGLQENPNFYASYMLMITLFGIYKCLFKEHNKFHIISTIIIYSGLILSHSTGPFMVFCLYLLLIIIYVLIKRKDLFNKIVIWMAIFVSLYGVLAYTSTYINKDAYHLYVEDRRTLQGDIGSMAWIMYQKAFDAEEMYSIEDKNGNVDESNPTVDNVTSNRFEIWKDTYNKAIKDHLWFGVGIDSMEFYKVSKFTKESGFKMYAVDKAHNIYINMVAETGIFSLIVYLLWMFIYHKKVFKSKNSLAYLLLFGIIGYNIQGIFNINVIYVMPYYYILVGMMIGLTEGDKIETRKH